MLTKPKFKDHFHVEVLQPGVVYLLSEKAHIALNGRLYGMLAPLLNGNYTVDEIVAVLEGQASATDIDYALKLLDRKGYITEAAGSISSETAAFWNLLDVDATLAAQRLQETRVSVTAFGNVPTEKFILALQSLNIRVSDEGDLGVALTDDYLHTGLAAFNQEALRAAKPWLIVKPMGVVVWIGPIFRSGTGCWQCLAQRLQRNREVETSIQERKNITTPFPISRAVLPSTLQTGFQIAATEIAKWIVGRQQLEGTMMTFDLACLDLRHHVLVKRPQCPSCGEPDYFKQPPQPLVLTSRQKLFTADGGHRIYSPKQTLQRYEHHISPVTGAIKSLTGCVPSLDNDLIHAYIAEHSFPTGNDFKHLRTSIRHKSFGKGKSDLQAKASALGEALERYSGIYTGYEFRVRGKYSELGSAIHPYACTHYSEAQYRNQHEWNKQHHHIQWIPEPFNETKEIEWTPVWSLTHQVFKYLPTAYCYYGYPLPEDHSFCWADTNGNSAGNILEEAILQGFMEVVERDAVALWWYNRVQRPAVNLASFDDPYLQQLKDYYQTLQRDFWVLDITSDLSIPTFAAISRRTNKQPEDILFGFGTHFDPKIALLRAVTELNQMVFLAKDAANPEGKATFLRQDMQTWCETATLENQPYLTPDSQVAMRVYADYPQLWSNDLQQDIMTCVEIAAKHGLETLVLDQTRPDIGMSVVKVVVPGLRHFWAQFAPGRLYDVPVKMGWLQAPLREEQLNPVPMFI